MRPCPPFFNPSTVFAQHMARTTDEIRVGVPRQILPGSRYLITRRCTQRQFLLRPTALTNQIFRYCLAVAAKATGVEIHAACVLSNHWHAVISDPKGRLPAFTGWLHKYVAKCINASLGRWENLWASEPPSYVRLESDEDVMDKIVYCLTNPVAAGLVPQGSQWGGVCTTAEDLFGCSETVTRPRVFFRQKGKMRATATLTITPPTLHDGESLESFVQSTRDAIAAQESKIQQEFANKEWGFLGMERVLAQCPTKFATYIRTPSWPIASCRRQRQVASH